MSQMNSKTIVEKLALRGRPLLHILLNKMVAERKNRTIIEATRAMLHDQGLLKFLWGEAANIAVYVQNRNPHQALDFKTLEEVFTSKKPNVSHFRRFGCPVYFHVPKEKRNKLEVYGKKGISVGCSENSKVYTIYVRGQEKWK